MSRVEAANEPVLITPSLVMAMPFGLTSSTVPGALMVPAIEDGVLPVTRLSVADDALGWLKLTVFPCPTENECQSMTARLDDWLTFTVLAFGELMLALPAATEPPVGSCPAWARVGPNVKANTAQRLIARSVHDTDARRHDRCPARHAADPTTPVFFDIRKFPHAPNAQCWLTFCYLIDVVKGGGACEKWILRIVTIDQPDNGERTTPKHLKRPEK